MRDASHALREARALHTRGSRLRRFRPSENVRKRLFCSLNPVIQFISNYAYYQYFLQALTPALTFTALKLLVVQSMWHSLSLRNYLLVLTARGPSKVDKGHRSLSEDI